MKSLLFLLAAIGLLSTASAVFVECAAVGGLVGGLLSGVLGTVNTLVQQLLTGNDCIATCQQNSQYNFAIFAKGLSLDLKTYDQTQLLGTCWCSSTGVPPNAVIPAADSQGTCTTTVLNLIGTRVDYIRGSNTVSFNGCGKDTGFPANDNTQFSVSSADQCFKSAQCQTKKYISIRSSGVTQLLSLLNLLNILLGRTGGQYDCACSNTAPSGASAVCGVETASTSFLLFDSKTYAFSNFAQVLPSGIGRRRHAEQMRLAEESARNAYCPSGKAACRVPGSSDYECIDTNSELESCGGCAYGAYGSNSTYTGTDCTALPGVVPSATSCWHGSCIVTRCRRGFTLVDGACI